MEMKSDKNNCIFETEGCWGDAEKKFLCMETGTWRTERPVIDSEKCNRCGICFIFCPPQCIGIDEPRENFVIDLTYCKGCGICARECPKKAVNMISEGEF